MYKRQHEDNYDLSKSRKAKIYDFVPIETMVSGRTKEKQLKGVDVDVKVMKQKRNSRKKLSEAQYLENEDWGFIQAIDKKDAFNNPILLNENDWIPKASKKSTGDLWVDGHGQTRPIIPEAVVGTAPKRLGIKMF